jgi:hypothetical protein
MIFGNARKQPADPSYNMPANRRVIWEHGQDMAVFLSTSVLLNIVFGLAVIIMAGVLVAIYSRPPYILTQDQGYVYYRSTEAFKMRSDMIRTFLDVVTTRLLDVNPGGYDISGIEHLVHPRVIEAFEKSEKEQADERIKLNKRQLWTIREMRRYYDPKRPQYLAIAVKGDKTTYEDIVTATGQRDVKTASATTFLMAYLDQVRPSSENPWGLVLIGFYEESDPTKIDNIWNSCVELTGSKDLQGNTILGPRQEYMPK